MPASPFPPLLSAKGVVTHYSDPAGPRAAAGRRRYNRSMRLLAGAVLALLTLTPPGAAQALRVVAVADFVDETVDGYQIGAVRLSADLQAYLAAQGRDRLRVVAGGEGRAGPRERQAGVRVSALAQAVIEIRVLQASTRRTLLSDTFSGIGIGITNAFLLRQAARVALQRAAVRISNL